MQIKDSRRAGLTVTGENVRQGKVYEIANRPSGPENVYLADDEGGLIRLLDGYRVRVAREAGPDLRPKVAAQGRSPLSDYFGVAQQAATPERPPLYRELPAKIVLGE